MENATFAIGFWGILAASAFCFVFAGAYFGALIAKPYAIAMGRQDEAPGKPTALAIVGPFLCNVVMILTSAALMRMAHIGSLAGAIGFGALVGTGYMLAMCMMIAINPNFPRPFYYTAINAPFFLLNAPIACAILYLL